MGSPETNNQINVRLTYIAFLAIVCYSFLFSNYWRGWPDNYTPFTGDNAVSYWYVPATFIYHDYEKVHERNPSVWPDSQGRLIPKYTYGMAVMYTPFFLMGHKLSANAGEKLDGYSLGYGLAIHYGCVIYGLLGFLFLSKILLRYFNDLIVAATLLITFFGTNLFHYILVESERVHGAQFFLVTCFVWLVIKWYEKPGYLKSVGIGLLVGLITMVRPTDILVVIIFIFFGVNDRASLKAKFRSLLSMYKHLLLMAGCFFLVLLPQVVFWKIYAGSFVYDGYGDEHFFFSDPALLKYLFSYRNGWFLYTPIMLFAFTGLFLLKKQCREFALALPLCIVAAIYILSSWWCWWYMGLGNRAMVQYYGLMAFGIAALIGRLSSVCLAGARISAGIKYLASVILIVAASANMLYTLQNKYWLLHWQAMNEKTYWLIFGRVNVSDEEKAELQKSYEQIDWDAAKRGMNRH